MKKIICLILSLGIIITSLKVPIIEVKAAGSFVLGNFNVVSTNFKEEDTYEEVQSLRIEWTNDMSWYASNVTERGINVVLNNITDSENAEYQEDITVTNNNFAEGEDDSIDIKQVKIGTMYEVIAKPYYIQKIRDNDGKEIYNKVVGEASIMYAITDLDVELTADVIELLGGDEEYNINAKWKNVLPLSISGGASPAISYNLYYAQGDKSGQSADQMTDANEQLGLQENNQLKEEKGKLNYTITDKIKEAQIYSVAVIPSISSYKGKKVAINRQAPIKFTNVGIKLSIYEIGDDIRLQWIIPSLANEEKSFKLETVRIYNKQNQNSMIVSLGTNYIGKDDETSNKKIGVYTLPAPDKQTDYYIELVYTVTDENSEKSKLVIRSPNETYIPSFSDAAMPTQPEIPKGPVSYKQIDESTEGIDEFLSKYMLKNSKNMLRNVREFILEKAAAHKVFGIFKDDFNNLKVNFVWSAFNIDDPDTDDPNVKITDKDIYYDIYVTDDYNSLFVQNTDTERKAKKIKEITAKQVNEYIQKGILRDTDMDDPANYSGIIPYWNGTSKTESTDTTKVTGFFTLLEHYYSGVTNKKESIKPEKLYYIMLVAKKALNGGADEAPTKFKSCEPKIVSFYYSESDGIFAPPYISSPPLEVVNAEDTIHNITLEWPDNWYEVIDPTGGSPVGDASKSINNSWTGELWIKDGKLFTSQPPAPYEYYEIYNYAENAEATKLAELNQIITEKTGVQSDLIGRRIKLPESKTDIGNTKFRMAKKKYSEVKEEIEAIQVNTPEYSFLDYYTELINNAKKYEDLGWDIITPTKENSKFKYKVTSLEPNTGYVMMLQPFTINEEGQELKAIYPTPIIVTTDPESETVIPKPIVPHLSVMKTGATYETIHWNYNSDFTYNVRYGITDNIEDAKSWEVVIPENRDAINFPQIDVTGLFPDTGYYFFIQSVNKGGDKSAWSNAVYGKTTDVETPDPPRGIGSPSDYSMKKYNYEKAITDKYVTIQWLLERDDPKTKTQEEKEEDQDKLGKNITLTYEYTLEFADNKNFTDPIYAVVGGEEEKIPDTVEKLEDNMLKINGLVPIRTYYIRMKTTVIYENTQELKIIKESEYSDPILIVTYSNENEYDSNIDPATEILPSKNYELIYNEKESSLTYRFRDNEKDEEGKEDNNVDQRLISDLIKQNKYVYNINLDSYYNKLIKERSVYIPYSILEAFDTAEIELDIKMGELEFVMPHDSIMKHVKNIKNQYGVKADIQISINDVRIGYVKDFDTTAKKIVNTPKDVSINLFSKRGRDDIEYTESPIKVYIKTKNRYEIYDKNPKAYFVDANGKTKSLDGKYNIEKGAMEVDTRNIGIYGVYITKGTTEISTLPKEKEHWSMKYKKEVDDKYTVTGLNNLDLDSNVKEKQYLNILYGIVTREDEINVNKNLSAAKLSELYNSGIINNMNISENVTRQEAINMMEMAYAIKNDLKEVKKLGIAKKPNEKLTYGEMFALWSRASR